jgi:hypothetical protein
MKYGAARKGHKKKDACGDNRPKYFQLFEATQRVENTLENFMLNIHSSGASDFKPLEPKSASFGFTLLHLIFRSFC